MIGYVYGKVMSNDDNVVLLENNGIGYEVVCSSSAFCTLMEKREGGVYTYLQVKEDGVSLFGFESRQEKNMFLKLISVSGVGAKMGMTILSGMSLKDLAVAIAASDVKTLSAIKGLGKKTAERIIVELREKMGAMDTSGTSSAAVNANIGSDGDNAVMALISLGYNRATAVKAVSSAAASGAKSVEELIAMALRSLA